MRLSSEIDNTKGTPCQSYASRFPKALIQNRKRREIGDGLPLIEVDLRPGREPERKKALVDAIAAVLSSELQINPEDVYVLFRETPAPGHYTGGTPLPEWVPADK